MKIHTLYLLTRIVFFLILLGMAGLMVYVSLNYYTFETKMLDLVDNYGFLAVFLISFFTDILVQPIGPDVAIIGGILLGKNPFEIVFFASIGSILASFFSFFFGKIFRDFGLRQLHTSKNYAKWRKIYNKYGLFTLSLGALTPVPYVPMCWIAGIFNINIYKFMIFGIIPRTIRFSTVGVVVHYFYTLN